MYLKCSWINVPHRKPKGTSTSRVINKHPSDVKTTATSSRYAALNYVTMDALEVISHAGKAVKEIANSNSIASDYHLNPSPATLTIGDHNCKSVASNSSNLEVPSSIKGGNHKAVKLSGVTKKGARVGKKRDIRKPTSLTLGDWIQPLSKELKEGTSSKDRKSGPGVAILHSESISTPDQWIANNEFEGASSVVH
ncbi:hypothetical protein V6N13_111260 [Hibiscus sabdariffa]